MKLQRYRLYVRLNDYNCELLKDRYTHYADATDARELMKAAKHIEAQSVIYDKFTGKIIWNNKEV